MSDDDKVLSAVIILYSVVFSVALYLMFEAWVVGG